MTQFFIYLSLQEACQVLEPSSRTSFSIILSHLITIALPLFSDHIIVSVSDQSRRSVEAKLLSETSAIFPTDIRLSGSVEKQKYNSHIRID
jgi:hypothetical protein